MKEKELIINKENTFIKHCKKYRLFVIVMIAILRSVLLNGVQKILINSI